MFRPTVGNKATPAFSEVAGAELAAPADASALVLLAGVLEVAGPEADGDEVAEVAADEVNEADDADEVALPPGAPGRPSNETSSARSPHRASRAVHISTCPRDLGNRYDSPS